MVAAGSQCHRKKENMFEKDHTHKTNHGEVRVALRNLRRIKEKYDAELARNNSTGRKSDAEYLNMLGQCIETRGAEFWLKVEEDGCWKTRLAAHWWRLWTLRH